MAEKKKKTERYQPPEIKTEDDRQKALQETLDKIEKDFGKGAVMRLGETRVDDIPVLPTGSLGVDIALGVGGIPCGRIIELFGPESSGKTTLALHVVAETQKLGGIAGYIDAEHALDPVYAKKLGVNIDELYISQPDDGEQALEIAEAMVRSGVIDIVVIDSVAALTPRVEIAGDMSESQVGVLARLMSKALRKLTAVANRTNCTILFINQLRDKIGMQGYGGPAETTTGGRALKFYASVRLDIRKKESIKVNENIIGSETQVKVAKNKVAPPFKLCRFDIMYGQGISKAGEILDMAAEDLKIVKKSGSWYSYGDLRLGQGRENAKAYLVEHPEISDEIEEKIRETYNVPKTKTLALAKLTTAEAEAEAKPKAKGKGKSKKSAKAAAEEEAFEYEEPEEETAVDMTDEAFADGEEQESEPQDDFDVDDLQFEE